MRGILAAKPATRPSLARATPSLARIAPSLVHTVPSLARAAPSLGRAAPSLRGDVFKPPTSDLAADLRPTDCDIAYQLIVDTWGSCEVSEVIGVNE